MMNVLGICLVVTSLATAGVWSPNPAKENPIRREDDDDDEVIVLKEGHRTVVVEFEKQGDGNTKVLISPHHYSSHDHHHDQYHHKLSEVNGGGHTNTARELVCDALGKCKHKISSAIGKAKEKVCEVEEEAKEVVGEALGKAKETVSRKAHEISDKTREVEEKAKEKVHEVEQGTKEAAQRVSRKAHEVEEKAKGKLMENAHEVEQKAKDGAKDAFDLTKTIGKDIQRNVSKMADAATSASEEEEEKEGQQKKKKNLRDILRSGGEVVWDVLMYLVNWDGTMMMGVIHLLGFATAYGMCVWVTFVSSYVLAEALPRQQFGMVHSKIYPVYFRAMAYCVGAVLFSHLLMNTRKQLFSNSNTSDLLQAYNLLVSFFMILANLFYLEPRATKVMFERMKLEKEEGRGRDVDDSVTRPGSLVADHVGDPASAPVTSERPEEERLKTRIAELTQRLKNLNNLSSFLNVLTLMGLSWHLVYLGQRLHSAS